MSNLQHRLQRAAQTAGDSLIQGEVGQDIFEAFQETSDRDRASDGGEGRERQREDQHQDENQSHLAEYDEDEDGVYNDGYDDEGHENYEDEEDDGIFYDENGTGWTERPQTYPGNSPAHLALPPEKQWVIDAPTLQAFQRNLVLWRPPFLSTVTRPYQRPRKDRRDAYAHVRDFKNRHCASKLSVMQVAGPHWQYPSDPHALEYKDPAHTEQWWTQPTPVAGARSTSKLALSLDNMRASSYENADLVNLGIESVTYHIERDAPSATSQQVYSKLRTSRTIDSCDHKLDLSGRNVLFAPDITRNFQLKDPRGPLRAKLPLIYSTPSGAKLSDGYAFWKYLALHDFAITQVDNVTQFVPAKDIEAASMSPGYEIDRDKKFTYHELEGAVKAFAGRTGSGIGCSWMAFEPMWFSDASAIFWDILPDIRPRDRVFFGVHETRGMNVVVLMKFDFIQKGLYLRLLQREGIGNGEADAAGLPVIL